MSLTKYVFVSFAVAGGLVYHALKTREQYFPAMLYLSTSKLSVVVLGNLAFALTLCFGHILKQIFLGQLREAEIERLYERAKDAIMETCLAMTIFREEFNVKFVVMFVSLLFVKIFHWLAGDRVEFMEQSPTSTRLQHVRVISLVAVLVTLDVAFLGYAVTHTLKRGPSVLLLFGFEYVILASRAVAVAAKYVIGRIDGFLDGRWDGKGTCVFYLELMTDLLHLFVYFVFFLIIFAYYGLPVHLVRDLYVTFRNFRRRVADFLRYRKVTANLNERFPDCSREELESGDDVCIICREDMRCDGTGGSRPKKLPCGHYFHLGCLRSWLERQQACPTCRAPVLPEEEADAAARRGANDAENDAADAAMRAAFERQLFGGNGPNAGGEANPPAERAGGDAGGAHARAREYADAKAGVVHHGEHRAHPVMRLTDEPSGRAIILHHRRGRSMQAHLVLEADNLETVGLARIAVFIRDILGHDEQADALGARHAIRKPRQNKVRDVLGKIVIAPGNINLLPGDRIGAIAIRLCLAAQCANVRPCLRLGEVHRPDPFARHQLGQVDGLDLFACVMLKRLDLAL